MMSEYIVSILDVSLLREALHLVWKVFLEFEAPEYTQGGVEEFGRFIEYETFKTKLKSGDFVMWGCFAGKELAGVLATRPPSHISLLFVEKRHHRKGMARALLNAALEFFARRGEHREMTVNSSPYAVEAYHRMGFVDTHAEQTLNGIRFTPMKRPL